MSKRKMTNIFIYPKFQFALLLAQIVVSIITLGVIYIKVVAVFQHLVEMGEKLNLPKDHAYYTFIQHSQNMMTMNLTWAVGFSLFLTIVSSLYLSHKVVGPIYRLRIYFKSLAAGEPASQLKFRKEDYFEDLPDLINEGIKKLKE